jgi:hypothetical protein
VKTVTAGALLMLCGCFHIRIDEKTGKRDFDQPVTVIAGTDYVIDNPCAATGTDLMNVNVSSNLGYAWLSVITFGIVNKVDIAYSCAPQTGSQPEGNPKPGGP